MGDIAASKMAPSLAEKDNLVAPMVESLFAQFSDLKRSNTRLSAHDTSEGHSWHST
jgi:hypothetical protein